MMRYVRRDDLGRVIAVSTVPLEGFEPSSDAPASLTDIERQFDIAQERLEQSDLEVIRVLDDLVNVLVEKNLIRFTDLPLAAQQKLLQRRGLRESGVRLSLPDNEDQVI